MTDVIEQLSAEEEEARLRRAEIAERLFAIDEQLERVDQAVNALRGKAPKPKVPRPKVARPLTERTGSHGGRVLAVYPGGDVEYEPAPENVEKVLAVLRVHGEMSQKNLVPETGLHMGTVTKVKRVLERDGVIDVYVPKKRPPDQGAGRISPVLRLK